MQNLLRSGMHLLHAGVLLGLWLVCIGKLAGVWKERKNRGKHRGLYNRVWNTVEVPLKEMCSKLEDP